MNILVIGSQGFIGSHCVAFFSGLGYKVLGCDIHKIDVENYIQLNSISNNFNQLIGDYNFNYCINAAGSANVNYSFEYPEKDFELNVSLVINLLGALKNHSPNCKFINFSSAAVYGNPDSLPIIENAGTKPLSPYGYHKLLSEKLLYEYYKFFGLKTCSLRVFSAFGEGLKKQLFWDLYQKSKLSDTINLFGTGEESRDFIYIKDLVSAVYLIMQHAKFEGESFNIANGAEITVREAASVFLKGIEWNGKLNFSGEIKAGDPRNWRADIKKISTFGYVQKFTFKEGIQNYCQWLKNIR
jgi:UDP-glucose 4-epimerase